MSQNNTPNNYNMFDITIDVPPTKWEETQKLIHDISLIVRYFKPTEIVCSLEDLRDGNFEFSVWANLDPSKRKNRMSFAGSSRSKAHTLIVAIQSTDREGLENACEPLWRGKDKYQPYSETQVWECVPKS